ncbi:hypothetical protein [Synechococcus sp. CBW1108]|uniref:hypothetical protein n=1 Tax=Synechococcus sp. CBW1108 TaxID=1353147 RepID=UPI0018CF9263|nr:hypothetical protein [Synechococcus sp. CBW1108]QPN70121.1 hypothetical protein H8F27_17145 [Synechococcus sp. CBW1108]
MSSHKHIGSCIEEDQGVLVFWSPEEDLRRPSARVQIIDVFALQVVSGHGRDGHGQVRLAAQPAMAAGRSWKLTRAAHLIRNDANPHRWVALQLDRRAWGLFWAGGGLQECRQRLADLSREAESTPAALPATPEALLRWILEGDPQQGWLSATGDKTWRVAAWTSLIWLGLLGLTIGIFLGMLQRQDQKLEELVERTAPATPQVMTDR